MSELIFSLVGVSLVEVGDLKEQVKVVLVSITVYGIIPTTMTTVLWPQ